MGIPQLPKLEIPKLKIPKLAQGGIGFKSIFFEEFINDKELVIPTSRTISKKRFIKLLMSNGFQKKQAIIIHNKYMETHKSRNKLQSLIYINIYGRGDIKIKWTTGKH